MISTVSTKNEAHLLVYKVVSSSGEFSNGHLKSYATYSI